MPDASTSKSHEFSRREFLTHAGRRASSYTVAASLLSLVFTVANATILAAPSYASEDTGQWGDFAGRFVYDGEPPQRKLLKITKDVDYCCKGKLREEGLIVDPQTKGIANVIGWLYTSTRDPLPPIHPSYSATATAAVPIDSDKCHIVPHVTLLRTTQTLLMRNTDPIGDGIRIDTFRNPPLNLMFAPNSEVPHHFSSAERVPASVSCPIHPWESGWLLVLAHPYMAVTDAQGRFVIKNVPAGKWTFMFWHEKAGYVDEVKCGGKPETWRRGRTEIDIRPGTNTIGTVKLAPQLFDK